MLFFTRMRKSILTIVIALGLGAQSIGQITSAPVFSSLRTMAEWEEVQALTISWTSFPSILKKIVAEARLQNTSNYFE